MGSSREGWFKPHSCLADIMDLYLVHINFHKSRGSANTGQCSHLVVVIRGTLWIHKVIRDRGLSSQWEILLGAIRPERRHPSTPNLPAKLSCFSLFLGFVYRSFEECLEFIHQNEDNRILKFQSGILLGLYSCIAIW